MSGLRWTVSVLVVALLLSGCVQPAKPKTQAQRDVAFSVEAPAWAPGYSWTFRTSNATSNATSSVRVAAPYSLEGRNGWILLQDSGYGAMRFDQPGYFHSAHLGMYGSSTDICHGQVPPTTPYYDDGDWKKPMLQFPLTPGKTWRYQDFVVDEFRVSGMSPLTVAAGTFNAVRIDVLYWFANGTAIDDFHNKTGSDEAGARRHGPVATFYYAPEVQTIVRTDFTFGQVMDFVPGSWMPIWPYESYAKEQMPKRQELTAYALEAKDPMSMQDLADGQWPQDGYCVKLRKYEADRAAQEYARSHPSAIKVEPRETVLDGLKPVTWTADVANVPEGGVTAWRILTGCVGGGSCDGGTVIDRGQGQTFAHTFAMPGAYRVDAWVLDKLGNKVASDHGTVVINTRIHATVQCLAALDATWLDPSLPRAPGCEPLQIPLGPGYAVFDAKVQGRTGDAAAPCAYVELLDPTGKQQEWVFSDHLSGAHLVTLLGGTIPMGDGRAWTLLWHPALTVASEAQIDVMVDYISPDNGFSFSGPGGPGC